VVVRPALGGAREIILLFARPAGSGGETLADFFNDIGQLQSFTGPDWLEGHQRPHSHFELAKRMGVKLDHP